MTNFNWRKAIQTGMEARGIAFSGKVGFIETRQYWPVEHMVAPKEKALHCNECHVKGGRLEDLKGFYMPGRDSYAWLTTAGWLAALMALLGTLGHAALRILSRLRRR